MCATCLFFFLRARAAAYNAVFPNAGNNITRRGNTEVHADTTGRKSCRVVLHPMGSFFDCACGDGRSGALSRRKIMTAAPRATERQRPAPPPLDGGVMVPPERAILMAHGAAHIHVRQAGHDGHAQGAFEEQRRTSKVGAPPPSSSRAGRRRWRDLECFSACMDGRGSMALAGAVLHLLQRPRRPRARARRSPPGSRTLAWSWCRSHRKPPGSPG